MGISFWSHHSTNYSDLPTFVIQGSQHLPLSSPLGLGSVVTSSGRWSLLPCLKVQLPLVGGFAVMHMSRDSWDSAGPRGQGLNMWSLLSLAQQSAWHEVRVSYILAEY